MTMIQRYEERVKFILGLLEDNPEGLRRKDIKTKWVLRLFPESAFNNTFCWLQKERDYIAKKHADVHLSPYIITEAGRKYLNGLRA